MRYLILGGKGQLAQEFSRKLQNEQILAADRKICDITKLAELQNIISKFKPTHIINCAAYNLVDLAEKNERDIAYQVNKDAVTDLAKICADKNIFLIHFSSDYVFNGTENEKLYTENDSPAPLNHYGQSKLEGEDAIEKINPKYLIFRTSWVYGNSKQNFIYKLKEWLKNKDQLTISCDEFSIPTATNIIADLTIKALHNELEGLYHLTNSGFCSRYQWVLEFLKITNHNAKIYPALRSDFNLAAERPFFSALSNHKLQQDLNIEIPSWQKSLDNFLTIPKE